MYNIVILNMSDWNKYFKEYSQIQNCERIP